jgi:SAM-dependent methyltransferase
MHPPAVNKPLLAKEALEKLLRDYSFHTVLDVGCGTGRHTRLFREAGKQVTAIDIYPGVDDAVQADYLQHRFDRTFDCVWVSHVLEHQLNVNLFLRKLHSELREGGLLAISIPPLKQEIVGGHVTLWNAGLLLYNLVLAGFDCSQAAIKCYGYNISLIMPKISAALPLDRLRYDKGDLDLLASFFPKVAGMQWGQAFNGQILQLNWDHPGFELRAPRGSWRRLMARLGQVLRRPKLPARLAHAA